ncbi:MAG: hypothetical protein G4V63_29710 [Candidatus Afipia apatlaquensis]|uniref:Phasin family protein n=1 Tax=Candidatus Afipia apatlaquensis TaxID=2712852 RepID=A0A7C9RJX9_9BRAD|nr:hypothetical protein [Candidatus Afipia apatlaquensis]
MSDAQNVEKSANGNGTSRIADQLVGMNTRSINLFLNVQKAVLEELIDVGNDALERTSAEFSIANEFASKIAEAHSTNGLKQVYEECGKHQADFIRRDSERAFKHWQRFLDRTSKVFFNQPPE